MKNERKLQLAIVVFFALGLIVGAGFYQLYLSLAPHDAAPALSLDQMYGNAIEDAMTARSSEIYTSLTPIMESNGNLTWQGESGSKSVLVVTLTRFTSSYPVGETVNTTWGDTWVTVVPEIKTFFHNSPTPVNLTLRAMQLLGLPSSNANTHFVEVWVNPQDLFRPAPDNEINDTTAQLNFPDSVTPEYKKWFNDNIIYSYFPYRYPWTRLGYTYDWGNSVSHVGLSEFVLKQNSIITVESSNPIEQYLSSSG